MGTSRAGARQCHGVYFIPEPLVKYGSFITTKLLVLLVVKYLFKMVIV